MLGTVRLKEFFTDNTEKKAKIKNIFENTNHKVINNYIKNIMNSIKDEVLKYNCDICVSTGGIARNIMEIIKNKKGKLPIVHKMPAVDRKDLKKTDTRNNNNGI